MPRNPTYPLEPLREHRDRQVDAATAQLGDAVRAREAADEAKRRAEAEQVAAEERAATVRAEEQTLLAGGHLTVADLARAQGWEQGKSLERADLERAVGHADGRRRAAEETEAKARSELAQKKADRDVVAKDEARFDDRARRARDASEEEAAEEVFAARRSEG